MYARRLQVIPARFPIFHTESHTQGMVVQATSLARIRCMVSTIKGRRYLEFQALELTTLLSIGGEIIQQYPSW